ncbi:MAG: molybdopterin molybdotransferase MoeA [Candidatus Hadarchaeales archaeon]
MRMKKAGFTTRISLDKAVSSIVSCLRPLETEDIEIEETLGRVIAEDITSSVNVPSFDRAAVDGYALQAADTFGASQGSPREIRLLGSAGAGERKRFRIRRGEAVAVTTGAQIPEGADAVVMLESTSRSGKTIWILSPVTPGKNISAAGEDVKKGDLVFRRGHLLRPCDVGLLASIGRSRVKVFRKPEAGVISTGSEVVPPHGKIGRGQVFDVNSYSISAAVESCGGIPHRLGIAQENKNSVVKMIREALKYDAVIITGGSAVGEKDTVPEVVAEMGELKFHGVAMRPGGPSAFGIVEGKPVFCLAGFPAGALVAFDMLVRPGLRLMQGLNADRGYRSVPAVLAENVASVLGRTDVVRVKLIRTPKGLKAEPIRITGSSMITTMTRADGFIMIPETVEGLSRGESVEVELY